MPVADLALDPDPPGPAPVQDPEPLPDIVFNVPFNVPFNMDNVNTNKKLMCSSISIQNVRSLNISTIDDLTTQKIIAICNLKSDFIFLSDLRLNSNKQISAVHDLEKKLFLQGYKLYHNSFNSLRGVGILIRKKFADNDFTILETISSDDGNAFCMHVEIENQKVVLCSVYGPNRDNEIGFFLNLKNILCRFNCPVVVGGDWNATFDDSGVEHNLDVVNMRNIPSSRRSSKILEMCRDLELVEPYRTKYPNKREYTFVPSGHDDNNRSRIDFFLISKKLYNPDINIVIPNSLTSMLFDHKPVTLTLKKRKYVPRNIIKDTILNNPDLDSYVKCAVFECYLLHYEAVPGPIHGPAAVGGDAQIDAHIASIGRIMELLNDVKNLELEMALNGFNLLHDLSIAGKRAEIRLIFEDLPDLEFFENLNNHYEPEIFFQTLVSCIKNNVLSHQSNIFKLRTEKKKLLSSNISELKQNFIQNSDEILRKERQLTAVVECELKDELMHYKKFEMLNSEKITPHFMNLVKTVSSTGNIAEIKRENGTDFSTEIEQKNYIQDYYKQIYSQPDNDAKNTNLRDIENFLGPLINHPIVLNAKLSNDERDELDLPLSLEELTLSINNANLSSAPGADGISNRFIKHYWLYFKKPLLKLCNSCYEKNELPMSFRTANIKLIPKKGDLSKIKNWRPISLLNCFYKIISRVITSRIRKYIDKMTPICQKGYSSSRYCQEVLISIIEGIERCNFEKKKGAVISLDIKKAFDSLSHQFLQGVYDFFNFGPVLKKWITLLSTKRKACIILEGGKFTEFFDLERGNAQGDTISPFLFNLGYQILLFKLELSFQIEGTRAEVAAEANAAVVASRTAARAAAGDAPAAAPAVAAAPAATPAAVFGRDALVSTDPKVAAMADDCTLLVMLEFENLRTIISFLNQFENISGLGCNIEKTALMPVGNIEPVPQNIVDLGLQIVNEITLLGSVIKNTGNCFEDNGPKIVEKIRKQVNFWVRFNLSLPGRICVAKTFMYSQINYLGCFLPLGTNVTNTLSKDIEKFVKGKLKIGTQKFYDTVKNGGLGLFKVTEFLASQCCAWVRRSVFLDELWKREFFLHSYGSVFNTRKENYHPIKSPILYYIASCYERFLFNFTSVNENYLSSLIFDNPSLTFDVNNQHFLKKGFFTEDEFTQFKDIIYGLTVKKFLNQDLSLKTKIEFENGSGLFLSELKFNKLRGIARSSVIKFRKFDNNEKKTDSVQNFCMRIRRGSKKFRKIISGKSPSVISTNIQRLSNILDQVINLENSLRINSQWGLNFLDNSTRTFLFKLHNNLLGINTRVAHFVRNHPRSCTFCTLSRVPDENPETIIHLFFDCYHTETLLTGFFGWIFNMQGDRQLSAKEFFQGFEFECNNKKFVLDICNIIAKKYIWDCKLRFNIPTLVNLKNTFMSSYSNLYKNSRTVRESTNNSLFFENHRDIHF